MKGDIIEYNSEVAKLWQGWILLRSMSCKDSGDAAIYVIEHKPDYYFFGRFKQELDDVMG